MFFLLFGFLELHAQFTYFNNRYNNDNWSAALTILETDPGYIVCGVSGQVSNGYIFNRIVLTSIDDEGNQVWWKTYGEDFHNYYAGWSRGLLKTSDGGYILCASIEDLIRSVALLMKIDNNGDSLWSRIYGDTISPDYSSTWFSVCAQLPDKGFLITGDVYVSGDDGDILLIRTDSLGNTIWENTYGELHWIESGFSIALLPDGNFLIGIQRDRVGISTSRDPGLLKVDSLGNIIWIKYYGGVFDDGQAQVILSRDGNYLVGTVFAVHQPNEDYPYHKIWLFKTDTEGNMLWERKYSDTEFTGWCSAVEELNDTSIIISGTGSFADGFGSYGWILKTKQNGDSIWMRRYSHYPTFDNHLNDLRITSDNGLIITGMTLGEPEWEQSIWVQKLDSIGCDSVRCDTTVGIIERQGGAEAWEHGGLEIWPNPARDQVHVRLNMDLGRFYRDLELEIYDIYGRQLQANSFSFPRRGGGWEGGWNGWTIDVSSFPPGVYIAIMKNGLNVLDSRKFIIAR